MTEQAAAASRAEKQQEQPAQQAGRAGNRDVLAELDSIEQHLLGLMEGEDLPGRAANRQQLKIEMTSMRQVARGITELEAEYARGVTHEQRVKQSTGFDPEEAQRDKARIQDLERQLEQAKGQQRG